MRTVKRVLCTMVVMAMVVSMAALGADAPGQGGQGGRGGQGGQGGPGGRGGFDPAQMRERMMTMIKERLGVGDEEWQVIQPRLEKVMQLNREATSGGMRGMFGRGGRGGRGGEQPGAANNERQQPQTATEKAMDELQKTLENKDARPEEIKAKLTALREAREKAKQELVKARESLRELLNQRQEAELVMMGTLD